MSYPYKDIREWLADEEKLDNVVRIRTPIKCGDYNNIVDMGRGLPGKQPETEIRAVCRYLHSLPGKPIGIIENPINNRPDIPLVVNPWATKERVLRGMALKNNGELSKKFAAIPTNRIKRAVVSKEKAPCKEVVIPEEKVDLRKDVPRNWVEFNAVNWSGCNGVVIINDPESGVHSTGKMRLGLFDWDNGDPNQPFPEERVKREGFCTMAHGTGFPTQSNTGRYYREHKLQNKPMPAAYAFGVPADAHTIAALKALNWPESGDDYDIIGGFRGEPIEVVESETIPGLMVPAYAEWVVEGEFLFEDYVIPPYGEDGFIGYVGGGAHWPIFRVNCITHRKEPLWISTTFSSNGLNGHEGTHSGLATVHVEANALTYLRGLGFKVKDVATMATGPFFVVIQLEVDGPDKPYPRYGFAVGRALSAYSEFLISLYIIVVGPDIDPHDALDVAWALGTRTRPISDTLPINQGVTGEQVIIDATTKVPERLSEMPVRSEPPDWEREAIKRIKEKIGS